MKRFKFWATLALVAACFFLAAMLPTLVLAQPPLPHILAVMLFNKMDTRPHLLGTISGAEKCLAEAERLNRTNEALRERDAREAGAEYVCLKIERAAI